MPKTATLIRRVEKLKAEIAHAEAKQRKKLVALPAKYGFASIDAVIEALQSLGGGNRGTRAKAAATAGKRTRAVITEAKRAKVKAMTAAGKTGGQIAKAVGISLPSVQNIKKTAGLVKARK